VPDSPLRPRSDAIASRQWVERLERSAAGNSAFYQKFHVTPAET